MRKINRGLKTITLHNLPYRLSHKMFHSFMQAKAEQRKMKYLLSLSGFMWLSFVSVTFSTHFCCKWPINSCNPMRAKTLRQKTVRIITSDSFFTDWNNAPTMVFRPTEYSITCYSRYSMKRHYTI